VKQLEVRFITYKNSRIYRYRFGSGNQPVICFHGYGESGSNFSFLEEYAKDQFTFIAIDLPFHGKTEWNEGLDFGWKDLQTIIEIIFAENDKQEIKNNKPILLGFSLGGRMALSFYQAIPGQVKKVILLAPDGLKVNFWYWLSTQTWLGNKFFYFTMHYPGWFFGFLKALKGLNLVNTSVFKFVKHYIDNKEVRLELYNRWTGLRKLKPNLSKIKSLVIQHKIPFQLVYGRHDRIMLSSVGEKFRRGIKDHCSISIIESGHQVLHEKHVKEIINQLVS